MKWGQHEIKEKEDVTIQFFVFINLLESVWMQYPTSARGAAEDVETIIPNMHAEQKNF